MRVSLLLAAMLVAACAGHDAARAADPRYPDWPCVQAKVPELSVAAMWAGPPLDDAAKAWENDPKIKDLVPRLAARRVPLEDAEKSVAEFVTGSAAEREQKAKLLFAGLFDRAQPRAHRGDERHRAAHPPPAGARRQASLRHRRAAQGAGRADPGRRPSSHELAHQVEWNTRIFEDRRKSIRFVCEVPVLIEQRLFALGARGAAGDGVSYSSAGTGLDFLQRQQRLFPAVGAVRIPGDIARTPSRGCASPRSTTSSSRAGSRSPASASCRRRSGA